MPAICWRQAMVTTATQGTRKGVKERRERERKRQGEKGRKSLARASSLKWFGERWHAKLESSVSPSPLWLHIKRNREKFLPTKINGAWGTLRSLNNTDYLVSPLSESLVFQAVWLKFCSFFQMQVHATFKLFKSLSKGKKKSLSLQSSLSQSKNRSTARKNSKQTKYIQSICRV